MMNDGLANQGDGLADRLNRGGPIAHTEDGLEAMIAARLGITIETDDNLADDGQPIRERAEDPSQGSGNVIGTPDHGDPLLHVFRSAGIL